MTPDSVRGMRDVLPAALVQQQRVADRLGQPLLRAGYAPIDLPLVEHRDLYLRKAGDELIGKLYHWTQSGRELALRPEWTASVLRAVIATMGDAPSPIRLCYRGPVFRYERPRRNTYRQFTQLGLELLDAAGPHADAEVIGLAVQGLHTVGISEYTLTIGHIGIIHALLATLGLPERTRSALTWNLERIRAHGIDAVREQFVVDTDAAALPIDLDALAHLDDADIEALLLRVLPGLGIRLDGGSRDPAAIVSRLVRKLRHDVAPADLERAWQLLQALNIAHGAPATVLPMLHNLLTDYGVAPTLLDELQQTLALVAAYGVPAERLKLDFGLGRGLHYYTGIIFEIDSAAGEQLCGGGRYDDLVAALGGRAMPAVGFAYGLERVVAVALSVAEPAAPTMLVLAAEDAPHNAAIRAATLLRDHGICAVLDVRGRALATNLNDARRRGMSHLVQASPDGMIIRDLATNREEYRAYSDEMRKP